MIPRILFKYPSRGRKDRFFEGLDSIYNNLADKENFFVLITADEDDPVMCSHAVKDRLFNYSNLGIVYGTSDSKVTAINRDMRLVDDKWEICIVMSDDMTFTFYGFDDVIRDQFKDGDFDKLIHIPDNDAKHVLAVMYIAGKTWYYRWGWIYNPIYKSLFCDDDIQAVAKKLGKYYYVDCPGMIFHANPAYGHREKDQLFLSQQEIGWSVDAETYKQRQAINFGL